MSRAISPEMDIKGEDCRPVFPKVVTAKFQTQECHSQNISECEGNFGTLGIAKSGSDLRGCSEPRQWRTMAMSAKGEGWTGRLISRKMRVWYWQRPVGKSSIPDVRAEP